MRITALGVYDKLLHEDRIKTINGQIRFSLGDVSIVVKKKDVVGNILQEWVEGWLRARGYDYEPNPNTQMPPDIFLSPGNYRENLLEIKAFNREVSPAFDIADFKAFVPELIARPYHIYTDFLIFGYTMNMNTGDVVVRDLWLKKIWEITKTMSNWPITVQYKNGILQKMRPGNWFTKKGSTQMFECVEDYLAAFEETVYQNPETRSQAAQWRNSFRRSYRNHFGTDIDFPKWDDIKSKYGRQ